MKLHLTLLAVALTGCASQTTGVVPIGSGGYMISKMDPVARFGGEVKAALMQEASAYCAKQGKTFAHLSSTSEEPVVYQKAATAEVQFRCN